MKVALCVVAFAVVMVVVHCNEDEAARIVGGTTAKEGDYPFFVNILELDRKTIVGAGVLLKSRVVLTTTYRFIKSYRPYKAEELVVQIGMHKRFEKEPSTQFLYVEEIVTHPRVDQNKYFGDLALLKLSSEPELNKRVKGDGGAPLLCTLGGKTKLVGLANAIVLDICEGGGTVFTGVAKYNEWIIKTAKMLQQDDIED